MEEEQQIAKIELYTNNRLNIIAQQPLQQDKIKQQNSQQAQTSMNQTFITEQKNVYIPQQGNISMKIRNRRFKKLLELRQKGFFQEQAIKLRHPLIYHLFIGQYQFTQSQNINVSTQKNKIQQNGQLLFSQFLQKHLINVEYRNLLDKQMSSELEKIIQIEKNKNEDQIKQIKRLFSIQKQQKGNQINRIQVQINNNSNKQSSLSQRVKNYQPSQNEIKQLRQNIQQASGQSNKNNYRESDSQINQRDMASQYYDKMLGSQSRRLTQQQKGIQQQHLIQYCEQLFLQGKLGGLQLLQINYKQIDENVQYDDERQQNKDLQDKYFNSMQQEIQQGQQHYYTGIQDY